MSNYVISIVKDLDKFQDRVAEVTGAISYESVTHVVAQLKDCLKNDKNLVALCAPQIGENLRLFVVKTSQKYDDKFKVFLNPMIVSSEGLHLSRETNASIPEKEFIIPRKNKIHVAYQTTDGVPQSETYLGAYAEIIQQMIEMLDGITLADYGFDLDDVGGAKKFDKATQKDKAAVIDMYLNSLKLGSSDINKEIAETPELNKLNKDIEFMTGVLDGQIKPIDENGNVVETAFSKDLKK